MTTKFYNPATKRIGRLNKIQLNGMTRYIANYQIPDDDGSVHSQIKETFEDAEQVMNKYGYFRFPFDSVPGEITTKDDLFRIIRGLTTAGFMFEIRTFYQGGKRDRAGYMVYILSHKSE